MQNLIQWASFKDIVRNSRPKGNAFKLGFTFTGDREDVEYTIECVQKKDGFEPAIESDNNKIYRR